MELMNLYNEIKNPIDDLQVIKKLLIAYSNSLKDVDGFYGQLIKTQKKEYNKGQYLIEDVDKFYSMMFNKWKNNILTMTCDDFKKLYKTNSSKEEFLEICNYLKTIPDLSTKKEVNEIFTGIKDNQKLHVIIEKYRWTAFSRYGSWMYISSKYFNIQKEMFPIQHRLYLNPESLDIYKIITIFILECEKYHLPYYFKFDQYADRDDTIIIYSSNSNLTNYIKILKNMEKEHPLLISSIKEPPILTGKIDNWIGYGEEPSKIIKEKNYSFNEIRAKIIENTIEKNIKNWLKNNLNTKVTYQEKKLDLKEYIIVKSYEYIIANLKRIFRYYEEFFKKIAKQKNDFYKEKDVINKLGYTVEDINSLEVKTNIYNALINQIKTLLLKICNNQDNKNDKITINLKNNKQISFTVFDLEKIIQELSVEIPKIDSSFIILIQKEIKNNARKYGILPNKFCFNTETFEKIKELSNNSETITPEYFNEEYLKINK